MNLRMVFFVALSSILILGCGQSPDKARMKKGNDGDRPKTPAEKAVHNAQNHTMVALQQSFELFRFIDWARNNLKGSTDRCPLVSVTDLEVQKQEINLSWNNCKMKAGHIPYTIVSGYDRFKIKKKSNGQLDSILTTNSNFAILTPKGQATFTQSIVFDWKKPKEIGISIHDAKITYTPEPNRKRADTFSWVIKSSDTKLELLDDDTALVHHFSPEVSFKHEGRVFYKDNKDKIKEYIEVDSEFSLESESSKVLECGRPHGQFKIVDYRVLKNGKMLVEPQSGTLTADSRGLTSSFDKKVRPWKACEGLERSPISQNLLEGITRLAL